MLDSDIHVYNPREDFRLLTGVEFAHCSPEHSAAYFLGKTFGLII
jgi:hypothetical protein